MAVFILQHEHDLDGFGDVKLVGIYASRADAEAARDRASSLPGFRDTPDGLTIDGNELGQDQWVSGFATVRPEHLAAPTKAA